MSEHARRVLFLTHRVPYPPDRGDRIRSYHLLRAMKVARLNVSLACVSEEPLTTGQQRALEKHAAQLAVAQVDASGCRARAMTALLTGKAGTPAAFYQPQLAEHIARWHREDPFDAVLTFCTGMWQYAMQLQPSPRVRVLDMVDVDSLKWQSYARGARWLRRWAYRTEAQRLRRIETLAAREMHAVTLISDAEVKAYRQRALGLTSARAQVLAVHNGVDLDYFQPLDDPRDATIGFVGVLDYPPNVEGVTRFVREVLPGVRQRVPNAKLHIVGRNPTAAVMKLGAQPGVEVVGPVDDVRPWIARSSIMIAPLVTARGVQNKVLEAMACQRPVVASPAAFEGINAEPDRDLVVAKSPAAWVDAVTMLLTDEFARVRIARAARWQMERAYRWEQTLRPLIDLLTATAPAPPQPVVRPISRWTALRAAS